MVRSVQVRWLIPPKTEEKMLRIMLSLGVGSAFLECAAEARF